MKEKATAGVGRSGEGRTGTLGAFSRALELQALKDENLHLERHLAVMVQSNRILQSMRSKKASFKF
jgi:hypothetical protein